MTYLHSITAYTITYHWACYTCPQGDTGLTSWEERAIEHTRQTGHSTRIWSEHQQLVQPLATTAHAADAG
jgi:hypothetical protein